MGWGSLSRPLNLDHRRRTEKDLQLFGKGPDFWFPEVPIRRHRSVNYPAIKPSSPIYSLWPMHLEGEGALGHHLLILSTIRGLQRLDQMEEVEMTTRLPCESGHLNIEEGLRVRHSHVPPGLEWGRYITFPRPINHWPAPTLIRPRNHTNSVGRAAESTRLSSRVGSQ